VALPINTCVTARFAHVVRPRTLRIVVGSWYHTKPTVCLAHPLFRCFHRLRLFTLLSQLTDFLRIPQPQTVIHCKMINYCYCLTIEEWKFCWFAVKFIVICMVQVFYRGMPVSVCVCLSVTSLSSTKTAKCRITQTTPHDIPGTLVFWCQRSPRNSTGVTPYGGTKCRWGGSKSATFHK